MRQLTSRFLDVAVAGFGLLALSPLLGLVALAILCEDGRPVFFCHARAGAGFRTIFVAKFRTMVRDADRLGAAITGAGDPRITRVGVHLRRWKLDELPQLWNVLRGNMSLVGPRPENLRHATMFRTQYDELLRRPPGITDPATLAYRHEEHLLAVADPESLYVNAILPAKLALSLAYARRRTFASDLGVLWRTVFPSAATPARSPCPPPG